MGWRARVERAVGKGSLNAAGVEAFLDLKGERGTPIEDYPTTERRLLILVPSTGRSADLDVRSLPGACLIPSPRHVERRRGAVQGGRLYRCEQEDGTESPVGASRETAWHGSAPSAIEM